MPFWLEHFFLLDLIKAVKIYKEFNLLIEGIIYIISLTSLKWRKNETFAFLNLQILKAISNQNFVFLEKILVFISRH